MERSVSDDSTSGGWASVAAIGTGAFALVTTEFLPIGLLPQITRELAISEGQAGFMVTLPGLIAAVAAPLTLQWARNLDRRNVLCALLLVLAVSNVLVAMASGVFTLMLGRVLLGLAVGGFWTIGGTLGPRLKPRQAAKATSLIFSGVSLGTVAGVPAGTFAAGVLGWRSVFEIAAVLSILVTLVLVKTVPRLPPQPGADLAGMRTLLKSRPARLGLLAVLMVFSGQFAAYTYISPFLIDHAAMSTNALSVVLLGFGAAGFLGNVMGGWAISRNARWTLLLSASLIGLPLLLLVLTSLMPLTIVLVMLWGVGFGLLPAAMQSWLFSLTPGRLEIMGALFVSIGQASIGAGALIGGLLVDHLGVLSAFVVGGVFATMTATLVILLRQSNKIERGRPAADTYATER